MHYAADLDNRLVKIAYSKHTQLLPTASKMFKNIIVSVDLLDAYLQLPENCKTLMCIPQYPVYHRLNGLIHWNWFDGFSSHLLEYHEDLRQLGIAECLGCEDFMLEKHVRFEGHPQCPDDCFAITWAQAYELCLLGDEREKIEWIPLSW
jgi:hypothetical protein